MYLRQEARARALQRLERHGARDVRGPREPVRPDEAERPHCGHELRPVDERQPLLRLEHGRLEPDLDERVAAGEALPVDPGLALADERQRQVCERREVAARADRTSTRDMWDETS